MDSSDKKMKTIMEQTLKEMILPRLDKIDKKLVEHDDKFAKHDEKFDMIIEAIADTKTKQLNHRVLKLESKA